MKKDHTDLIFAVYLDGPLSRTDCSSGLKLVMLAIRAHYSPNRAVYPGIPRLAALVGLSEKQVKRHIKTAKQMGFLTITKGLRQTNTYTLSEEWKNGHPCPAAGDIEGTIDGDIEGTMEGTPMSPKEYPMEEYPIEEFPKKYVDVDHERVADLDHPTVNPCANTDGSKRVPRVCNELHKVLKDLGCKHALSGYKQSIADDILTAAWIVHERVTSGELARHLGIVDWPIKIAEWKYIKTTASNYAERRKDEIWRGKPELQSNPASGNGFAELGYRLDALEGMPEINEAELPF